MTGRTLDVYCFGERAGTLTDTSAGLAFEYLEAWVRSSRPPLSHSLPLNGDFDSIRVDAFFGGLLPEGRPRERLCRQLGVSLGNTFGLLERLGGDTAGAISVLPSASPWPLPGPADVEWLDDTAVCKLIDELPNRPMHADEDGEFRLSLAGAQDKLPVVISADGQIGLTKGRTPSTHILKTPIDRFPATVVNEAFCLALASRLGITAVEAAPRRVKAREFLLVKRYDRDDRAGRLHQEDFCQALAVASERKYESEGGPGLADCFQLIREATTVPARESIKLLDYVGLSFLVGNHNAHAKNYSLLYLPDSPGATLAPVYDVLSTIAYEKVAPMSRRLAMRIGGENRPDYVRTRHLDAMLESSGLGGAAARRRLRDLAARAPDAAAEQRRAFVAEGWDADVLARIEDIVVQRAGWIDGFAARRR